MSGPPLRIQAGQRTQIDVAPRFADAVRERLTCDPHWCDGLFEAPADEAARAAAPQGRAPLREVTLDAGKGPEALLVRTGQRGGWLAPLLRDRHASPERVRVELTTALTLRAHGAPVPEPVFAAARRDGFVWRTAFASVRIAEAQDLRAVVQRAAADARADADGAESDLHRAGEARPLDPPAARALACAVGRAIRAFHECGGAHADLQLGNVLVSTGEQPARAWLVDLDRARCGAPLPAARRMSELMRLRRSLRKHGRDDRRWVAACFGAYCAGDRALRGALQAHAAREWARVTRHERHRPLLLAFGLGR